MYASTDVLFQKQDRRAFGLQWCLFLLLILCIDYFLLSFLITGNDAHINENTYWHETGRITNCSNRLPHEVLGCASAIILIIFFQSENLPTVGRVTPTKYSIFYNRIKICVVNWFQSFLNFRLLWLCIMNVEWRETNKM